MIHTHGIEIISIFTQIDVLNPTIYASHSMFYGIVIYMYYFDNRKHHLPHIHAEFAEHKVVLSLENGDVLEGSFPKKQLKLAQAWIAIHEDELKANWNLAIEGQELFKIDPLR